MIFAKVINVVISLKIASRVITKEAVEETPIFYTVTFCLLEGTDANGFCTT